MLTDQLINDKKWIPIHESVYFFSKETINFLVPLEEKDSIDSKKYIALRKRLHFSLELFNFIKDKKILLYFIAKNDIEKVPIPINMPNTVEDLDVIIIAHINNNFQFIERDGSAKIEGQIVIHKDDILLNEIVYNMNASLNLFMQRANIRMPTNKLKYIMYAAQQSTLSSFQKNIKLSKKEAVAAIDPNKYWQNCGLIEEEPSNKIHEAYDILSVFADLYVKNIQDT